MKRVELASPTAARRVARTLDLLTDGAQPGVNRGVGRHRHIPKSPDWDAVVAGTEPFPYGWTSRVFSVRGAKSGKATVLLDELTDTEVDDKAAGKPEITGQELAALKQALKKTAVTPAKATTGAANAGTHRRN